MTDPESTPVQAERRMSDIEALMWNVEKDPYLSSVFGSVTVFDAPVDVDRLRRRMQRAVLLVPRLRQRVVSALGRLAPPEWQDDPDFDLDFHLRRIALPAPGSERQLFDLAALIVQDPFDRTRPLWEFMVVDGLQGGRSALVQKMHHAITDGEGGIRMSVQFIDLERDAVEPGAVTELPPAATPGRTLLSTAAETLAHNLRRQAGVAKRAAESVAVAATHPGRVAGFGAEVGETVRSLTRQVAVTGERRSTLWTDRSLRRHFTVLQVSLDQAKRAAKALGGTINDIFVTGAAGGAGAYHRLMGAEVEELRMAMPVSTRTDRSSGGNAFAPSRVVVPVSEDPVARFEEIRARLSVTKRERALALAGVLAGVINVLPTSMLVRFARAQAETVDFTTSNVRAAPFDLYIAGARIEANYPMGPLAGTAWNLTTMSYRGSLDMGLHADPVAVGDPELLRRCLEDSFAELLALG
jgi:WS/DGAT/MGAT family acyltransferase